jgi:hypothetical protein
MPAWFAPSIAINGTKVFRDARASAPDVETSAEQHHIGIAEMIEKFCREQAAVSTRRSCDNAV